MQVITPNNDSTLYFVPRAEYSQVTFRLTNVSTQKTYTEIGYPTYTDNQMSYVLGSSAKDSLELEKGQFVDVSIVSNEYVNRIESDGGIVYKNCIDNEYKGEIAYKLVYRGRLFCTDQTINQSENDTYSVNQGEYTEHESTNDYIIYE